jgi:hypothetical protein
LVERSKEEPSARRRLIGPTFPRVSISWPLTQQNLNGKAQIIANAAAGPGAAIASIALYVDRLEQGEANRSLAGGRSLGAEQQPRLRHAWRRRSGPRRPRAAPE